MDRKRCSDTAAAGVAACKKVKVESAAPATAGDKETSSQSNSHGSPAGPCNNTAKILSPAGAGGAVNTEQNNNNNNKNNPELSADLKADMKMEIAKIDSLLQEAHLSPSRLFDRLMKDETELKTDLGGEERKVPEREFVKCQWRNCGLDVEDMHLLEHLTVSLFFMNFVPNT